MKKDSCNIIPIGGEPFYPPSFLFATKKNDVKSFFYNKFSDRVLTFTYGGFYSIKSILDDIQVSENEHILLPSYLCSTILLAFKEKGIKYSFYKITRDLRIDVEDLQRKVKSNTKALFFINYFGFDISSNEKEILRSFQDKGLTMIQDLVQGFYAGPEMLIGDYAFNSFRKFFPAEGSCIISNKKLEIKNNTFNSQYFINKLLGRYYRYKHYNNGLPVSKFLEKFSKASLFYHKENNSGFTYYDEFILNKFDFKKTSETRRRNFLLLLEEFRDVALIKELVNNVIPLAFPIVIENRDSVMMKIMEQNIFCPIHWKLSKEIDVEQYGDSWWLSDHILSIPINSDINYISVIKYLRGLLEIK